MLCSEPCSDSFQQQERSAVVHDLAATELRRLRERALLVMSGVQAGASLAQHVDTDDRWAME